MMLRGGLWDLFQRGGPVMYPILFCSIIALAVVIDRVYHLRRARVDTEAFMERISNALRRNRIVEAIDMCEDTPGPIAHILKAGLLRHDRPRQEVRDTIEDAAMHEVPRLQRYLNVLGTVTHVSPLLGLLGTVTGMVSAFQVIEEKSSHFGPVNPGDLASGIWEALLTTVFGLCVAIPALVAYNWLMSWVNRFVLDMERSATEMINVLSQRKEIDEV
ncbi:MAG: MotA/TolQ/ExbB proton channel family protein [Candidatus Omnitrophota bacterium]